MKRPKQTAGFTLIELLLVLAIIAILAGIAVPSYLGQRTRARVIGDAQANAANLRMQMESYKADNGVYASGSKTFTWNAGVYSGTESTNPAPNFTGGNTKMNYSLAVASTGLSYTLTVSDPTQKHAVMVNTNQNGSNLGGTIKY